MEKPRGLPFYGFDGEPVSPEVWQDLFADPRRYIGRDEVGDIRVSTVWLGIDHSFGYSHKPLIFETMCFGGPLDQEPFRCSTWEEARTQHEAMLTICKLYTDYPASIINVEPARFFEEFPNRVTSEEYIKAYLAGSRSAFPSTQDQRERSPKSDRTGSKPHSSE